MEGNNFFGKYISLLGFRVTEILVKTLRFYYPVCRVYFNLKYIVVLMNERFYIVQTIFSGVRWRLPPSKLDKLVKRK